MVAVVVLVLVVVLVMLGGYPSGGNYKTANAKDRNWPEQPGQKWPRTKKNLKRGKQIDVLWGARAALSTAWGSLRVQWLKPAAVAEKTKLTSPGAPKDASSTKAAAVADKCDPEPRASGGRGHTPQAGDEATHRRQQQQQQRRQQQATTHWTECPVF